jgi:hypothetical protein
MFQKLMIRTRSVGSPLYFRYDGDLAGGNTNHALSAGIRFV